MDEPSDHLLRTFGALPASSRILDLGCRRGLHTEPLVRLGFNVYACDPSPDAVEAVRARIGGIVGQDEAETHCSVSRLDALGYPEAFFDWIVAFESLSRAETREALLDILEEARRVLKMGGWFYVAVPAVPEHDLGDGSKGYAGDSGLTPTFTTRTLTDLFAEAGFVTAEEPSIATQGGQRLVQAIYRKIDEQTRA